MLSRLLNRLLALAMLAAMAAFLASQVAPRQARSWEQVRWLQERGRHAEAVALAEELTARERQRLGPAHPELAITLEKLANLYEADEDLAAAHCALSELVDLLTRLHGDRHWRATDARLKLTRIERRAALDPAQRRSLDEADGLLHQAFALRQQGEYRKALALVRQAADRRKQVLGEEDRAYASALNNLAVLHLELGEFRAAEPLLRQVLAIEQKQLGKVHPDLSDSLNNLGWLCLHLGDYVQAGTILHQALDVTRQTLGEEHPNALLSMRHLGILYRTIGDYHRAEPLLRRVLEIQRRTLGEAHPHFADSLGTLGMLYVLRGEYARAEPLLRQAVAFTRAAHGAKHRAHAFSLHALADLYLGTGDYEQAEPLLRQALEIRKEALGEENPEYATSLHDLGLLYLNVARYDRAEPLLRQALEITRKVHGERHPEYATCLDNLARLYIAVGDFERAKPLASRAVEVSHRAQGEKHPALAVRLSNLGFLYRLTGDLGQAEGLFLLASELLKKTVGEEHPEYAANLIHRAFVYQATGRPEQARALLVRSMGVQQSSLEGVFRFSAEPAMHAYLSRVSYSLDALMSMVAESADPAARAVALTWALRRKAVVFNTLCRFRQAQHLRERDPAVAEQVGRLRAVRTRLSDLSVSPPADLDVEAVRREVARLQAEAGRLEAELNRSLTALHPTEDAEAAVDTDRVQRQLTGGAALVEFLRVEHYDFKATGRQPRWKPARYFAFVLTAARGATPQLIDLGKAAAIEQAVRAVREQLTHVPRTMRVMGERALEKEFRAASADLYRLVFAPLRAALGEATLVHLAPDGELNRVPFEALVDTDDMYLVERYRFAYLSSGRDLLRPAGRPGRGTTVFAGPDYDLKPPSRELVAAQGSACRPGDEGLLLRSLRWDVLPGAADEAADVEGALQGSEYAPVHTYVGSQALETVFKAVRGPRVLHVATHGFFLPDRAPVHEDFEGVQTPQSGRGAAVRLARLRAVRNPLLRSGLVFAGANTMGDQAAAAGADDGWVTAEEIALMDLQGTELVVLSACESGLGDVKVGEGVYGLRRAFLHAGARTLVASLFKVPDAETRQLMRRFYQGLKDGRGKLEALHEARLEMVRLRRHQSGAAHPFFWASFVLVGSPNR